MNQMPCSNSSCVPEAQVLAYCCSIAMQAHLNMVELQDVQRVVHNQLAALAWECPPGQLEVRCKGEVLPAQAHSKHP